MKICLSLEGVAECIALELAEIVRRVGLRGHVIHTHDLLDIGFQPHGAHNGRAADENSARRPDVEATAQIRWHCF